MYVYIDIETIRATMTEAEARALVKVPGNIKKPESIQKHIDKSWPAVIERSSLHPMQGSILCVVMAAGDGAMKVIRRDLYGTDGTASLDSDGLPLLCDEGDMLRGLGYHLQALTDDSKEDITLVTWNGDGFDLPWLWRRAVMHRGSLLADYIPHGERGRLGWRSLDLMKYWAGSNGFGTTKTSGKGSTKGSLNPFGVSTGRKKEGRTCRDSSD